MDTITASDFGADFRWGTATAAFQIEGAVAVDGRGPSIWDKFTKQNGKIKGGHHAEIACDFYNRYEDDLELVKELGFKEFRFSLSWSRILPTGTGEVNQKGIDFYNRVIDKCLDLGIEPWITLYHWDLPQALEDRGGWKNREIIDWFSEYVRLCATEFGDKVKNWIVLNEPTAVAGLGYTTGMHAPGKKGIFNFLPVVHHLALCNAEGGRIIRNLVHDAYIGTALSCSHVQAFTDKPKDVRAAQRADAIMNRLFVEPALGLGYPTDVFPFLNNIKRFTKPGDEEKLAFDFDFIGLQNYFRIIVKHSYFAPVLWLEEIPAKKRNVPLTVMGWEVAPDGMYDILRQFSNYSGVKEIIISENGAAFEDNPENGKVVDERRIQYFEDYLKSILKAKNEGVKVAGYLAWSLLDNFEWAEGYHPRFGLVYVNYETQERIVKESGKWFASFFKN
ncbi:GH1 family beta-glucosidase [Dyadobacter sp. CY345]|uniref:GH1 family beta-glucosidase n=1 Tax=Dyadobacter sp. CY345 TaxID=2909335 RepID=UPI001F1AA2BC|nr:GH1 family beta-glucosidase [Dyadobacter sp. CY345]MCF2442883.1 GH1 family beta-glucosidase [Dyadobacter sp. CY345]